MEVHIDNASLWGSLGDKGRFRSPNILQIADVARLHAVIATFLDNISVLTTKTTQPHPQVFTVTGSITCNQAALLTSF